jgi:hypothetical protein
VEGRENGFFSTRTAIVEISTIKIINSTNDGEERGGGGVGSSYHFSLDLRTRKIVKVFRNKVLITNCDRDRRCC